MLKIWLLAFALLNEAKSCEKSVYVCHVRGKGKCTAGNRVCYFENGGTCTWRDRRSSDIMNLTKTELLKRTGTHFSITLDENPCVFETYDLDNDDIISKEELEDKLSDKKETQDLFAVIDTINSDGEISQDEFCAAIPTLIDECEGCCHV